MSDGGFFKVYRKAYDSIFAKGAETWAVFSWIMFQAEWAGDRPGEVNCTAAAIAGDCGVSRAKVRRAIEWLEQRGTIRVETRIGRGRGMSIKLVNWAKYQGPARAPEKAPARKVRWVCDEE